ncbi:MAG: bifunctional (p)ppGpp synthetase/guanosine-3',5'-bis(diphosphate) 3'-pyrophosphohydrolase [Candidatus Portnoybacteria bacterium]|nr:bifunctional (p)ppGpp synthetase/guanosine-3',5'-bis(diphosphate) 3'-pyrophosphohydrolase [Candidatus Portnoybacteria bacterium]
MEIKQFLEELKKINPELDFGLIEKACFFAQENYQGLTRLSGQTYLDHCLEIALDLAKMKLDSASIAASILHETLERTKLTKDKLRKNFGQEITFLVEGVTNVGKIEHQKTERSLENLRKLFLTMAQDIRVVLIKSVNRLHGLKTLHVFPLEKQKRIALETLEIYAPLTYRLGMGELKGQLEDLAFAYAYPQEYQKLISQVKDKYIQGKEYLQKIIPLIKKILAREGIKVIEVHARAKHHYSLYKKLQRYDMDWHKIYDLVALRIIVPDIESCYATLGIIHKKWKPLIGRIKDYIAIPKPNGYQSLHTTVFCQGGKITEFQIRTPEIHKEAEYGIAAHWYYSEERGVRGYIKKRILGKKPAKELKKELTWVKQLQEWQKEKFSSSQEFIDSLKIDFLKDRIFVFTPQGDIIDLPEGATPIDFAYQIHSDVGHQCSGAKIDGKLSSLSQLLQNGQLVEIITQKNKKPNRDWLKFAKTNEARSKIKAWFKKN